MSQIFEIRFIENKFVSVAAFYLFEEDSKSLLLAKSVLWQVCVLRSKYQIFLPEAGRT